MQASRKEHHGAIRKIVGFRDRLLLAFTLRHMQAAIAGNPPLKEGS